MFMTLVVIGAAVIWYYKMGGGDFIWSILNPIFGIPNEPAKTPEIAPPPEKQPTPNSERIMADEEGRIIRPDTQRPAVYFSRKKQLGERIKPRI